MKYGAFSEIGKLRKVMVCRPGLAHKRLTPGYCKDLLFDDVIWGHGGNWGKPDQRGIRRAPPAKMAEFPFLAGSMGPKVGAARMFAERTGKRAAIGALEDLPRIVAGEAGTTVTTECRAIEWH
jgi:hypothetical protein